MKKCVSLFLAMIIVFCLLTPALAAEEEQVAKLTKALDYSDSSNWAYFEDGEGKDVDVFLICPTVDTRSYANSLDLNDKLKKLFINALNMEKGIYEDSGRMFSPFYRQMSINAYSLEDADRSQAEANAYLDVSAAFRWYLENENDGRPVILAGFSQGSQMCVELLKEFYGRGADALREKLVAVYAIGWSVTEKDTKSYPQIVPAKGETDTGVVVSFDCEDGSVTDTIILPAGEKSLSINPLNWKTDGTVADKALNSGAVMGAGAEPIPGLCGTYKGDRGQLVVTDVTAEEYPPVLDIFPKGSYHIYDYMFFFNNLRQNVAARTTAFLTGLPFKDVSSGAWYADAVKYIYGKGLMTGTADAVFSPSSSLTRAQLLTVLWRRSGSPDCGDDASYTDVSDGVWYTGAANWAYSNGLVIGAVLELGRVLTREETAVLLWKYARYLGADVSAEEMTDIAGYKDLSDVSVSAAPAMKWAVGAGVINGMDDGRLSPRTGITRAQTAAMLMRFDSIDISDMPLCAE